MTWKLLHKPTGLFYGPRRSKNGVISNLSETGSVYVRKPTIKERPWFRDTRGVKTSTVERAWIAVKEEEGNE